MGESDFIEAWHNHCHTRCGGQLTPMVNTACNLDPYDQTRRAKRTVEGGKQGQERFLHLFVINN